MVRPDPEIARRPFFTERLHFSNAPTPPLRARRPAPGRAGRAAPRRPDACRTCAPRRSTRFVRTHRRIAVGRSRARCSDRRRPACAVMAAVFGPPTRCSRHRRTGCSTSSFLALRRGATGRPARRSATSSPAFRQFVAVAARSSARGEGERDETSSSSRGSCSTAPRTRGTMRSPPRDPPRPPGTATGRATGSRGPRRRPVGEAARDPGRRWARARRPADVGARLQAPDRPVANAAAVHLGAARTGSRGR